MCSQRGMKRKNLLKWWYKSMVCQFMKSARENDEHLIIYPWFKGVLEAEKGNTHGA